MTTGQRKDILCDLCEDEQALSFCGECICKLGDFCKLAHTRQKETKDHSLAEIESVKLLDLNISCSVCNSLSEKFCQECDACFCTKCADAHHQLSDVQTSTLQRGDNLTSDPRNYSTSSILDSPASQPEVCRKYASSVCDLCDEEHATMYCDECQLNLGDFCQQAHTKQKLTKKHHLTAIPDSLNVPCSSCDEFAEKFCSECEVHLCSQCAGDHHKLGDTLDTTADKTCLDGQDKKQPILDGMKVDLTTETKSSDNLRGEHSSDGQESTILDPCTVEQNNDQLNFGEKTIVEKDDISTAEPATDKTSQLPLTASESGVKDTDNYYASDNQSPEHGDDSNLSHYSKMPIHPFSTKAADTDGPKTKYMTDRPGKPTVERVSNNSVDIIWTGLHDFRKGDVYQVRIENTKTGQWESQNFETNSGKIRRLQQGSTYVFKVRLVYANGDESQFSDKSEQVTTHTTDIDKPGKPAVERLYNDSVDIIWTGLQDFSKGDVYQVGIENTKTGKLESQDFETNRGKIKHLQQGSTYVFKVRLVYANGDESQFSEKSDVVTIPIDRPGKPTVERLYNDSVDIIWDGLDDFHKGDVYQVRIENTKTGKWESQDLETNSGKIRRLQQGTTYVFKVRLVYANGDESQFSEKSEEVTTHTSYASKIVSKSVLVTKGNNRPDLYRLPMEERKEASTIYSKKFDIGPIGNDINEKTIMLVGATGTGKSTFVDVIANYVMGVMLDDAFRFTVMQEEDRARQQNQAVANTEIVTCYSFNSDIGTVHSYRLNVVDTPGFGDMRGPERDEEIVKQLQQLFEAPGEKGIQMIDAICIFIRAPDCRLTPTQTYIFNAIMSMFGSDIAENMCTIITFNDGDSDPLVMDAVKESGLPFGKEFTFNNLAFIADPKSGLTSIFWDKCLASFSGMFKHLDTRETKSMQLTKYVLKERQALTLTCQNLAISIKAGISTIQGLKKEINVFEQNQDEINKNKDYTYEVTESKMVKRDLPVGIHVTNCLICNRTCHERCAYANDDDKSKCVAMDGRGYCKECPNKCYWQEHKNTGYAIDLVEKHVQKTYAEMLKRYQEAKGKQLNLHQLVEEKRKELKDITAKIESMLEQMKTCNNRLKEISLRPNPLGLKDQLDLMILAEEYEGKEGYQKRIEVLREFRERAAIDESVQKFKTEESSVEARYNTLHVS